LPRALAIATAAALLFQGAAWAYQPVHCSMTGVVSSGHCACDHGSGQPRVAPDCCHRTEAAAAPSVLRPFADLAVPAPASWGIQPVASPPPPAFRHIEADVRGLSPPLELLHRSLLR